MGIFQKSNRNEDAAADQALDKVDARLEALTLASKRPVTKRQSVFSSVKIRPKRQEA